MTDFEQQEFTEIAEVYEEYFVPALFHEWPEHVLNAANLQPGQRVLDVACGTGIVARAAAERAGADGSVTGLDISEGMLAVAARVAPEIEWRQGDAHDLPFSDGHFDAVLSQFGLMFFADQRAALREMVRVLKPGGRLAVAVWDSLDHIPGYAALVDLLYRLFGDEAADEMRQPFSLGDTRGLQTLFAEAGIPNARLTTLAGKAVFPSLESWLFTNIKGWVLAHMLDDKQYDLLLKEAHSDLARFVTASGSVEFKTSAHIISAVKA